METPKRSRFAASLTCRRVVSVVVFAIAVMTPVFGLSQAEAAAQSSGGSFGGGGFGGGSSGGGGFGGGSSGGGGFGGGSSGGGGFGGGSSGGGGFGGGSSGGGGFGGGSSFDSDPFSPMFLVAMLIAVVAIVAIKMAMDARQRRSAAWATEVPSDVVPSWQNLDVSVLLIGIDWRARRYIQAELERIASEGDTQSSTGLLQMLHASAAAIANVQMAWLYAGAYNAQPMHELNAERAFRDAATRARERYRHEVVRAANGGVSRQNAPAVHPRDSEGDGIVVVTLIVAARNELRDVHDVGNANQLGRALAELRHLGGDRLVALEVVWSPALDEDRMSSAELEALYPDMRKIDDTTMAGRVFCGRCGAPFAGELGKCPHCGAPLPSVTTSA